jgi:colicin import membrane protein
MSQAAFAHDALLPRAPGGNGVGALLALIVHGALLAALTTAVDWRAHTPDVVSAELWASVPQAAAPLTQEAAPAAAAVAPAPAPAPAPPLPTPTPAATPAEPDIALERAERRKADAERKQAEAAVVAERKRLDAENRKAEAQRKKKEQEERVQEERQAKAEAQGLARQREENLRRMMGQAGGATGVPGGTGTAAQNAAPSAAYAGRVAALIRRNSVFTGTVEGNPAAEVEVRAAPNGTIIARRLVKGSGFKEWDDAVLRAIDRAGTLPRDVDGRVPQTMIIAFRPNE